MTLTSASLNIRGLRIMLNEKGCLFCQLHISQEEVKNMGYAKLGAGGRGEGGKQGVLRERYQWRIGHFRVTKYSHFQNKAYCRTSLMHFVRHRQINAPVYFVKHRQINAPVYLLNTGKLMPQCIL